ncbi:hypothetical protein SAMN05216436_11671 [bacterium A37T11]|nr:hypothetical protein SAMN05216436_11671 [bacterium A37T11]
MKKLIFISLLFTSCSVFKHQTENSSYQKDLTIHSIERRDSLQLTAQSLNIQFLSDDQLEFTEIIPEGNFVYRPDSGFRGAARSLRVYRQTQQLSLEKDTVSLRLAANSHKEAVDSTVHERNQRELEVTKESKPLTWTCLGLAGILAVLIGGWIYTKTK